VGSRGVGAREPLRAHQGAVVTRLLQLLFRKCHGHRYNYRGQSTGFCSRRESPFPNTSDRCLIKVRFQGTRPPNGSANRRVGRRRTRREHDLRNGPRRRRDVRFWSLGDL